MKQEAAAQLESELRRKIKGDVLFDRMSRLIYATDASLYQMIPMGVVLPKDKEDLIQAVRTAARDRVPILPRGGGTSLAGQAVSPGLVIDCSKHLNRIIEIDTNQRWVRVEPGIVLDELNQSLQPTGLFFSPDPATSSRANIGGMIGNNSSGTRSIRYGKTIDKILDVGVLLSTGEEIRFGPLDRAGLDQKCRQNDREGEIYRKVRQLVRDNRDEIKRRYPKVMRRVSGYNLDALLDE
ncbi:MAG TPA: FAD-binding oxidoreductase, partial [Acidobacteriota bacterium]|nr:FAD-binding oxidoreductase [Acidobacteriota bacterium]